MTSFAPRPIVEGAAAQSQSRMIALFAIVLFRFTLSNSPALRADARPVARSSEFTAIAHFAFELSI
jgi:hypothetical protein